MTNAYIDILNTSDSNYIYLLILFISDITRVAAKFWLPAC